MVGHVSPEAARGGPIAAVRKGDEITIDLTRRRLDVHVPQAVVENRLAITVLEDRAPLSGALGKYARCVTSASRGACTTRMETWSAPENAFPIAAASRWREA